MNVMKSVIPMSTPKPGHDTIVLSGGGAKGIAQLGAVHNLSKRGMLRGVRKFVGTSVGALVAATLAVDMDPEKTFLKHVLPFKYQPNIDLSAIDKVFGVDSGRGLESLIASLFDPALTMRDVYLKYGNELVIVTTNLNHRRAEYLTRETSPDMTVADALKLSCSVPLFFGSVTRDGWLYCDGAVSDNFAVNYAASTGSRRVLGVTFKIGEKPAGSPWTFGEFMGALVETSLRGQHGPPENSMIISLDVKDNSLDFNMSRARKRQLFSSGFSQAALSIKKRV